MRLGILISTESWYWQDLRRAAGNDHDVVPLRFTQLQSAVGGGGVQCSAGNQEFHHLDGVLVRTMPPGSLEQVVFRMDVLGRAEAAGLAVINPPRALEAAVDKYLATARLAAAGLPVPETIACQTVEQAFDAFDRLGSDVVVKPLFGSEGRGLMRVSDTGLAERTFKTLAQLGAVIYLQPFIEHEGFDIRILVVGDQMWAMKRINHHDWRTNVSRGAVTEPYEPTDEERALAIAAATTIGAPLAGVDLLSARGGPALVIEVNAVPGWKSLAKTLDVDIARKVMELMVSRIGGPRHGDDTCEGKIVRAHL